MQRQALLLFTCTVCNYKPELPQLRCFKREPKYANVKLYLQKAGSNPSKSEYFFMVKIYDILHRQLPDAGYICFYLSKIHFKQLKKHRLVPY